MTRSTIACPLSVALLVIGCDASPASQRLVDVEFTRAYLSDQGVEFEPADEIDWVTVAHRHFDRFDLSSPPAEVLRANLSEIGWSAVFEYEAPLSNELVSRFVHVLTSDGPRRLEPERLLGRVRYDPVDFDAREFTEPRFYGVIAGRVDGERIDDAGFTVWSTRDLEFTIASAQLEARTANEETVFVLIDEESDAEEVVARRGSNLPGPRTAYRFSIEPDGGRYLFIRWSPDSTCEEICCEFSYSLFDLSSEPRLMAGNDYQCDV